MKKYTVRVTVFLAIFMIFIAHSKVSAEDIQLSQVKEFTGMPLMEALKLRTSSRKFSLKKIPPEILSELMWAASGINRPGDSRRTAPTAMNMQELEIYAAMESGLYRYIPEKHMLKEEHNEDIRKYCGSQDFVASAPLNLIYVADLEKMSKIKTEEEKILWASADSGFIGQNVYLYCASRGLSAVFRAYIDKEKLAEKMKLPSSKKIIFSQTVGYPG